MGGLDVLFDELDRVLGDPDWNGEEVNPVVHALVRALMDASPAERDAVVERMVRVVREGRIQQAGIVALTAGTAVEQGGPAVPLFDALVARLPDILAHALRFAGRVQAAFPMGPPEDVDEAVLWVGPHPVSFDLARDLTRLDRASVQAWNCLGQWCMPLIACASSSRDLLDRLRTELALIEALAPLDGLDGPAGFLLSLCLLPNQERWHAFHRPSGRGFALLVDGVASNFELHTLLSAALAPHLGHEAPAAAVLMCVRGNGPQQGFVPSKGAFDIVDLGGLGADRWNEGRPADVPAFEGVRSLLLDAPSVDRSWNTTRTFGSLQGVTPSVTVIEELAAPDARQALLSRFGRHTP